MFEIVITAVIGKHQLKTQNSYDGACAACRRIYRPARVVPVWEDGSYAVWVCGRCSAKGEDYVAGRLTGHGYDVMKEWEVELLAE